VSTASSRVTARQPPQLVGPADHVLELEPLRYQFNVEGTILHSAITDDWDANWVVVRMAAADGNRRWSSTDPVFLTWELQRLVNWLRAVADRAPDLHPSYATVEPNLRLEAKHGDDGVRLRAVFSLEFAPPSGNPWIDFTPDRAAVHRFADALDVALASFPIRAMKQRWTRSPRGYQRRLN
jgi:hypothetical protein